MLKVQQLKLIVKLLILACCSGCSLAPPKTTVKRPKVVYVNPQEELSHYAEEAAKRWWNTIGIDIRISDSEGIPITIVKEIRNGRTRARTFRKNKRPDSDVTKIEISQERFDEGENAIIQSLTHEFGHLLGFHGHTKYGIMKYFTLFNSKINNEAIDKICNINPCLWKKPE